LKTGNNFSIAFAASQHHITEQIAGDLYGGFNVRHRDDLARTVVERRNDRCAGTKNIDDNNVLSRNNISSICDGEKKTSTFMHDTFYL